MKLLSLAFGLLLLLSPAVSLRAQDDSSGDSGTPAAGAGGGGGFGGGHRLDFLSQQDRRHYMRVRRQVMAANPDLKSEQESLMKEMKFVHGKGADATAQDKETLRNNFMAHHEKMDAAMKTADPSVAPILDQINQHFKEMFEQRAGGAGGGAPEPGA